MTPMQTKLDRKVPIIIQNFNIFGPEHKKLHKPSPQSHKPIPKKITKIPLNAKKLVNRTKNQTHFIPLFLVFI